MKTRKNSLLALIAVTALGAAGCSSQGTQPGGEASGEVLLWMYPVIRDEAAGKEFWEDIEERFEEEHDGLELTIEMQSFNNRDAQISAALAAGSGPDLVMITPDQVSTYLGVGGLLPVDEAIADSQEAFYPSALDAVTYDGELYGAPLFQNANTVSYNTAIFEENGLELPQTWDDVLAAAPVLADAGVAALEYAGNPEITLNLSYYPLLWQAGGQIFTEDGEDVAFDSKEGVAALQFLLDLQELGGLSADSATASNAVEGSGMAAGDVAMRLQTNLTELSQLRAALGDDKVALGLPLTGEEQVTFASPGMLSLTSINSEDNREAAYEVIEYLTSPEIQAELNAASGSFPTRTDVEASGGDADAQTLADALEFGHAGEPNANARQVMAILAPYLQSALQGNMSAREALSAAATDARELIGRS